MTKQPSAVIQHAKRLAFDQSEDKAEALDAFADLISGYVEAARKHNEDVRAIISAARVLTDKYDPSQEIDRSYVEAVVNAVKLSDEWRRGS